MLTAHAMQALRRQLLCSPIASCLTARCTACVQYHRSPAALSSHLVNVMSTESSSSSSSTASTAPTRESTGVPTAEERETYRKSRIYTRTGDTGMTSLYNLQRRCKAEDFFQALGTVDEVNSQLGVVREHCVLEDNGLEEHIIQVTAGRHTQRLTLSTTAASLTAAAFAASTLPLPVLSQLQSRLLDIGAHLATPLRSSSAKQVAAMSFPESEVRLLEHWIDKYDAQLPKLTSFVLPSGGLCASHLHVSRSMTRRAEREVVPLCQRGDVSTVVLVWLNRLSDCLFVFARYAAMKAGKEETTWKKQRGQQPQPAATATDSDTAAQPS